MCDVRDVAAEEAMVGFEANRTCSLTRSANVASPGVPLRAIVEVIGVIAIALLLGVCCNAAAAACAATNLGAVIRGPEETTVAERGFAAIGLENREKEVVT